MGNWYGLVFELLFSGAVIAFILWELYTLRRDSKLRDKTDEHDD